MFRLTQKELNGNIVIKGADITPAASSGAVVAFPAGILYLCGERLP